MTKATTETPVAVVEVEKFAPISNNDCHLIQHAHNTWCAVVPKRMTVEQLEEPGLWAHNCGSFKHMDRMQVAAKDGSMIAFGLVTFAQGLIVKLKFYQHFDLVAVAQPEIHFKGYVIRQISAVAGWEIVSDDPTGEVLKDKGLPNQTAAINYLQDHFKANAA